MIERLEAIEKKYNEIKKDLTNPEVMSDFNKIVLSPGPGIV